MTQPSECYEECIVHEGGAATARLASMGLRVEYIDAAVWKGHDRSSQVSRVHPRTYKGQVMWAEAVAELRTQLLNLNQDWEMGFTNNYETSFHLKREIAIAIVGADTNCGERAFAPPKAVRKRGPITAKRVQRNLLGQQMFDLPEFQGPPQSDELCDTWFLMLNARGCHIYRELSIPTSLGSDNRFGRWRERILIPPMLLHGATITPAEPDESEPPRVNVGRK